MVALDKLRANDSQPPLLIKEVVLENFMSYEYARIPLKEGLNVICGPNGSGKSSILLGVSVALGQTYTERSRKLSDLVRWGRDIARVTLVLDNLVKEGRRPLPQYGVDRVTVSRYLRRDGTYWFEINRREVGKEDVLKLFKSYSINPDNMVLIMHQGMVEDFITSSSQKKLKMVEEAVGLKDYRENIIEARRKLAEIISEEEAVSSLLENAEQTLNYWREKYEKFLRRKELLERRGFLEKELAWSQVVKKEADIQALEERLQSQKARLDYFIRKVEEARALSDKLRNNLNNLTLKRKNLFQKLLALEKEVGVSEASEALLNTFFIKLEVEKLSDVGQSYLSNVKVQLDSIKKKAPKLAEKVSKTHYVWGVLEEKVEAVLEEYVKSRVDEAVLNYRKESVEEKISELSSELEKVRRELQQVIEAAEKVSPRIETKRGPMEVSEEIKLTNAHLTSLGEVSEDAEKMYKHYLSLYEGLKEKLQTISKNRERIVEEVQVRMKTWKSLLENLLEEVNPIYGELLSKINAVGIARIIESEDIEKAGLELLVGFRGAAPAVLNAYTQSGGERSVSVISFLLALQKYIKSPFRAVDEFDIHMDPRNREAIYRYFISLTRGLRGVQHIIITPGPVVSEVEDVHLIFVQNVGGRSGAREVVGAASTRS